MHMNLGVDYEIAGSVNWEIVNCVYDVLVVIPVKGVDAEMNMEEVS